MNKNKKIFIAVWIVISTGLFYFFQNKEAPQVETEMAEEQSMAKVPEVPAKDSANPQDELPAKLKGRIDTVLEKIEGMWDPTGSKVKEVGEKMEALEKALEENKPELAEKILSEIEVIVSEK